MNKTTLLGDANVTGDEKTEITQYAYNSSIWLVDQAISKTLLGANSAKVSEVNFSYDGLPFGTPPQKGDVSRQEQWLSSGGSDPVTSFGYDSYGNKVNVTDPRGGVTKFIYGLNDASYTYPNQVVNPLGQVTNVSYLLSNGALNYTVDPNGFQTQYVYDIFGRMSSVVKQYDSLTYPTVQYAYFTNSVPNGIRTQVRVNSGVSGTFDSVSFVDGLGRQIQSRIDADSAGQQVVKNMFYDSLGRVSAESVPYFTSYGNYSSPDLSVRNVTHQYDPLDREIKTVNTDNTYRTLSFNKWNVTATDENGHVKVQSKDAYGRITDVYEVNGGETYRTMYNYDGLDDLVNITDNVGNVFRFAYDSLKRKTGLSDPDSGNWSYSYDASGNLVNQTDASGTSVKLEYDLLDRLTKTDYPTDTDVVLTYDVGKIGVLSQADSPAGTVKYEYDSRLRQIAQNYTYGSSTWWIRQAYDALDRVVNVSQSNGEVLNYTYNGGGMLESIPGYVTGLDYSALGKVSNRTYANGLVSQIDYYSDSFRLKSIKTGNLQNLSYSYDDVGNVLSMNDFVNGSLWSYGYDNLDRLTSAVEAGSFNHSYSYNSVGNIVSYSNGTANFNYSYGVSAGPHAVTGYNFTPYVFVFGPTNISGNFTGVVPVYGSDWNITSNTTANNGIVRLNKSKTVYVAPNKSLSIDNLNLEPTELSPGGFILLDAGSILDLGAGAVVSGDDASYPAYSGTQSVGLVYDAMGSMVNDSRFLYSYNDDNRMSSVKNQSGSLKETYLYDHGGSRKIKTTILSPALNKTTFYLSQSWIREEYSNGTVRDSLYVYGNNELLARKDSAGNKHYNHPDHLGSTTVITKQDGTLEDRITYEPYGQPRQFSQEMYQYTSQEWESDFGIYDYNARQYNPILMRFMQADMKIQNPYDSQLLNRYGYVRNNPLEYTDPSGHDLAGEYVAKYLVNTYGSSAIDSYNSFAGWYNFNRAEFLKKYPLVNLIIEDMRTHGPSIIAMGGGIPEEEIAAKAGTEASLTFGEGLGEEVLAADSGIYDSVGDISQSQFRKNLISYTGESGREMEAHHLIPRNSQIRDIFNKRGITNEFINSPENGMWVPKGHGATWNLYQDALLNWINKNKGATAQDIINFARQTSKDMYG